MLFLRSNATRTGQLFRRAIAPILGVLLIQIFNLSSFGELVPGSNMSASARIGSRSSGRKSSNSHSRHSASTRTSHGRHAASHGHHRHHHDAPTAKAKAKPKYAYPLDFFMWRAPEFDRTPFDEERCKRIHNAFACGIADNVTPQQMVRAGVFRHYPLSGGIFERREPVRYIVLHSTETGPPVPAKNVINAWNSGGRRHAGAQYVVDRDGTIYQALDPEYASVHVNIFKTLPGINNDNTIGIEMNHTGRQNYPPEQRAAVIRLVHWLQDRFHVTSDNVITHKYAQQGDHTDPVNMDVEAFLAVKENFRQKALSMKRVASPVVADEQTEDDAPVASVYVQIHGVIRPEALRSISRQSSPAGANASPSAPAGTGDAVAPPQSITGTAPAAGTGASSTKNSANPNLGPAATGIGITTTTKSTTVTTTTTTTTTSTAPGATTSGPASPAPVTTTPASAQPPKPSRASEAPVPGSAPTPGSSLEPSVID